jgi:uncharacterized protein (DUF302 family)
MEGKMGMMQSMVSMLGRDRRENMMREMMPLMMDGIDLHEFMPKMMASMLKDLSAEDIVAFLKDAFGEKDTVNQLLEKIIETNMVTKMMMKSYTSMLDFDETVEVLERNTVMYGWEIPQVRNLQKTYIDAGLADMTRVKILYLCNPEGGYAILKSDDFKAMSVMMPMPVSVYEKNDGTVGISSMNLGMMAGMFSGAVKEVLKKGAEDFEKSLQGIVC